MPRELYRKKENRDARAKELRAQGHAVKRSSARNQQLHPEYLQDWEHEVDSGIGNVQYKTMFSAIYIVSW